MATIFIRWSRVVNSKLSAGPARGVGPGVSSCRQQGRRERWGLTLRPTEPRAGVPPQGRGPPPGPGPPPRAGVPPPGPGSPPQGRGPPPRAARQRGAAGGGGSGTATKGVPLPQPSSSSALVFLSPRLPQPSSSSALVFLSPLPPADPAGVGGPGESRDQSRGVKPRSDLLLGVATPPGRATADL
ncbi:unnamed protein product [Boreogadus saida]